MKKEIIISTIGALMLIACNNNANQQVGENGIDSIEQESTSDIVEKKNMPEFTETRLQELLDVVGRTEPEVEKLFTKEYFSTIKKTYELPEGGLGDIAGPVFLDYLVCGTDPCPSHTVKLNTTTIEGDTAVVKFNILHEDHESENSSIHTLKLVLDDDEKWIIADYDNSLNAMNEYIVSQLKYLEGGEFEEAAKNILDDPEADEDWKESVRQEMKEVKEYLKLHTKK